MLYSILNGGFYRNDGGFKRGVSVREARTGAY